MEHRSVVPELTISRLTFNGQMGQHSRIKCTSFYPKWQTFFHSGALKCVLLQTWQKNCI